MNRLLYLSFSAADMPDLGFASEVEALRAILGETVQLIWERDPQPDQLSRLIHQHQPQVLHWSGHGTADHALVLPGSSATEGNRRLKGGQLSTMLGSAPGPALLVLNACFGGQAAQALTESFPSVLSWANRVPATLAQALARALYGHLAQGGSVEEAVALAQRASLADGDTQSAGLGLEHREGVRPQSLRPWSLAATAAKAAPPPAPAAPSGPGIALLLDVYPTNDLKSLLQASPQALSPDTRWLRYCEQPDAPRMGKDPTAFDWTGAIRAVETLAQRAQGMAATAGQPVSWTVLGQAPLPLFTLLGHRLSRFGGPLRLLHYDPRATTWTGLDLPPKVMAAPYFDHRQGLDPAGFVDGGRRLNLYVHASRDPMPAAAPLRAKIEAAGAPTDWPNHASLGHTKGQEVTPAHFASIAAELRDTLGTLGVQAQALEELSLFLLVPAPVAFVVGWAINPNQIPHIALFEHQGNHYKRVHTTGPRSTSTAPPPAPITPTALQGRHRLRHQLGAQLQEMQRAITIADLTVPQWADAATAAEMAERLARLRLSPEAPAAEGFFLDSLRDELFIGDGFTDALLQVPEALRDELFWLFLLHELLHDPQDLPSETYTGIGRAAVALAELDDAADAFALVARHQHLLRRGGLQAAERCGADLRRLLDAILHGLAAFDRAEQGPTLHRLPERRLRRYLRWAFLRARAEEVRHPEAVGALLTERLVVELVPTQGVLDKRYEKLVQRVTSTTELVIVAGGRLIRQPAAPFFQPQALLDHINRLEVDKVWTALRAVVVHHRKVFRRPGVRS